jgi:hypothetical protein
MKCKLYLIAVLILGINYSNPSNTFSQSVQQAIVPTPDHVVIVILENQDYDEIMSTNDAAHIGAIANDDHSALFTQSFAIEHPSQPNYFDLFAGCNQGVMNDAVPTNNPFTTDNLARELLDVGKTFITYSEDLPSVGYNGYGSGNYARKHNPCADWMGTGTNQIPMTVNQPYSAFPKDFTQLPTVSIVVPNLTDDMHDGGIPAGVVKGDQWVNNHFSEYIDWSKTHNSLFILTFDEAEIDPNNQVVTIFAGQMVKPGQYSEKINHYSILRTLEDMYGLRYACNAASADPITDTWFFSSGVTSDKSKPGENFFSIVPNPSNGDQVIRINEPEAGSLKSLEIFDVLGKKVFEKNVTGSIMQEIPIKHFAPGSYLVKMSDGRVVYTQKLIMQ